MDIYDRMEARMLELDDIIAVETRILGEIEVELLKIRGLLEGTDDNNN